MLYDLIHICQEIASVFVEDPSAPGVTISLLPDGRWYASVLRYTKPMGKGKVVLAKAEGVNLVSTLATLKDEFTMTEQYRNAKSERINE